MTTYRRFCCNDLLRLGTIHLDSDTQTCTFGTYLVNIAKWPGNCVVADEPGGRITAYIFGTIEGTDEDTAGRLSLFKFARNDTGDVLASMLEAACDKLYKANGMKAIIEAGCMEAINGCMKMGYSRYKSDSVSVEMHKKFRLILLRDSENVNDVTVSTSYDRH